MNFLICTALWRRPRHAPKFWPIVREALSTLEAAIALTSFDPSKAVATFRDGDGDPTRRIVDADFDHGL